MSVALFILILLVLVVGHELGHFFVAKWTGMKVPEFGVGFPPKLWGIRVGETEYTINALPFGGFVKIVGEDAEDKDHPDAFGKKPKLAQAAVLFAGPGMNVVLGFFAFFIALMIGVPSVIEGGTEGVTDARVIVADVLPGSPAAQAGVERGDTVVSINDVSVTDPRSIAEAVQKGDVTLALARGETKKVVTVSPTTNLIAEDPTRLGIGIASVAIGTKTYSFVDAFVEAGKRTVDGLWGIVVGLASLIGGAFTLSSSIADISGPVGIATLVGDAAAIGAGQILILAAIISLNLAVINLIPFPALDGGRLALLAIETVRGKEMSTKTVMAINSIGFLLLISLMVVVTWNDIARLLA